MEPTAGMMKDGLHHEKLLSMMKDRNVDMAQLLLQAGAHPDKVQAAAEMLHERVKAHDQVLLQNDWDLMRADEVDLNPKQVYLDPQTGGKIEFMTDIGNFEIDIEADLKTGGIGEAETNLADSAEILQDIAFLGAGVAAVPVGADAIEKLEAMKNQPDAPKLDIQTSQKKLTSPSTDKITPKKGFWSTGSKVAGVVAGGAVLGGVGASLLLSFTGNGAGFENMELKDVTFAIASMAIPMITAVHPVLGTSLTLAMTGLSALPGIGEYFGGGQPSTEEQINDAVQEGMVKVLEIVREMLVEYGKVILDAASAEMDVKIFEDNLRGMSVQATTLTESATWLSSITAQPQPEVLVSSLLVVHSDLVQLRNNLLSVSQNETLKEDKDPIGFEYRQALVLPILFSVSQTIVFCLREITAALGTRDASESHQNLASDIWAESFRAHGRSLKIIQGLWLME